MLFDRIGKLFNRKAALGAVIGLALGLSGITAHRLWRGKALISVAGAVLRQDTDLAKQLPVANAQVFLGHGSGDDSDDDPRYDLSAGVATTDSAGQFRLK